MAKSKKGQKDNNDLQNTTQKTKDRVTRTPLENGGEFRCSGRLFHKRFVQTNLDFYVFITINGSTPPCWTICSWEDHPF